IPDNMYDSSSIDASIVLLFPEESDFPSFSSESPHAVNKTTSKLQNKSVPAFFTMHLPFPANLSYAIFARTCTFFRYQYKIRIKRVQYNVRSYFFLENRGEFCTLKPLYASADTRSI